MIHIFLPENEAEASMAQFFRLKGYTVIVESSDSLQLPAVDRRMKLTLDCLKREGVFVHMYDYVWIMRYVNERYRKKGDLFFSSVKSYRDYIVAYLHNDGVAGISTLSQYYSSGSGDFPDWTFSDTDDAAERLRRINIAQRFASVFVKGV